LNIFNLLVYFRTLYEAMKKEFAKFLFTKVWGWRVEGEYPYHVKKFLITVAPHTSFQDFPIGILFRNWYGVKINFVIKAELGNNPIIGPFIRWMGGIPVQRNKATNFVQSVAKKYEEYDSLYITITPEGTRKKVDKFKSGFYYIAKEADIPILPIVFDFEHKTLRILSLFHLNDNNPKEDIQKFENLYRGYLGKHPQNSFGSREPTELMT